MPNTAPINDNAAITRFIIEQANRAGFANVFPIGAITKASDGTELAEMGEMKTAGIVATDSRSPRDGKYLEQIGTYNPMLPKDSGGVIVRTVGEDVTANVRTIRGLPVALKGAPVPAAVSSAL